MISMASCIEHGLYEVTPGHTTCPVCAALVNLETVVRDHERRNRMVFDHVAYCPICECLLDLDAARGRMR